MASPQLTLLAGGPSQGRRDRDAYFTDPRDARMLVGRLPIEPGQRALEPSVGAGGWVEAIRDAGADVDGVDIDPESTGLRLVDRALVGDFLEIEVRNELGSWDWCIGNPPYARDTGRKNGDGEPIMESIAAAHVRKALQVAENVAFLLRLAFFESEDRADLMGEDIHPRHVIVLRKRPQFIAAGGKSNPHAMAFFWWQDGYRGPTTVEWL